MKLVHKLWLGIGIALLAVLGVMVGFGYWLARENVEASVIEEGRSLQGVLMAVRRTYQNQFVSSGLPIDENTIGFLPAHAMTRIAKDFQAFDRRGIRFNNVSDRPRNPANGADAAELEAIRYFRANPAVQERLSRHVDAAGGEYFLYATPIRMEPYCMRCHGDPADAPAAIRERYDTAWDYKVGDLRGILSIKVPADIAAARLMGAWRREQGVHLALVALALLIGGGVIHRCVVRRLSSFRQGVRRLAQGEYGYRVPQTGADELADLARGINEMAHTVEQARDDLRLTASVFARAREGILITDPGGVILDVNSAFSEITGWPRIEALGKTPRLLNSGRHDADFYAEMWRAIREDGHWLGEVWNKRRNGEIYPERLSIAAVWNDLDEITHYIGIFSDISLIKHQEQQLQYIAHHDPLTGVPNRVLLGDRMRQAIARARRTGQLLAVGYLDLDGFKPVNDNHGHESGDRLLIEMARRITQTLRGADTVARLGGDEFVFLLQDLKDVEECNITLERLLTAVSRRIELAPDVAVELSASIGVTVYPTDDADPDTLLRHADQAMYVAKQAGRNRYHYYDLEGDQKSRAHRESRERIRLALDRGEFELHYQPEVNMRTGEVVGAEALIRWQHPQRGLLPPSEFLPVIEGTDIDLALGEWVLETAFDQMSEWLAGGTNIILSINVSAHHIQHKGFVDRLKILMEDHPRVQPARIQMEILETAALEDLASVSELIHTCRKLGSNFALDDFGTGYSSLTYLKRLPVQTLKIDKSFVSGMLSDPDDLAIVEGVIALAEAFDRKVIAEGVDSLETGLLLLQLGCPIAQGFSIARPMPGAELPAWIEGWRVPCAWSEGSFKHWHHEDFSLLLAEYNHREWIDSLADRIDGTSDKNDPLALDPETCRFSRWYSGPGRIRYGEIPEFVAIDPLHRQVHELGQRLIDLLRAERRDEARRGLPELFALRNAMLDELHALQRRIYPENPPEPSSSALDAAQQSRPCPGNS